MTRLRSDTISGITGTSNYQGSIYASGTSAYLRTTTTAPGTDDFTIECWINSNDAGGTNQEGVFGINAQAGGFQGGGSNQIRLAQGRYGGGGTNGGLEVDINGTAVGTGNGNDIIQEGTWYHVAVTRASGTVKIWVDGVEKASGSAAGNVTGTTFVTGYYDGNYTYQGYMSNFRYRKGTAHYTTTFTPPTGPLERTTDTELIFAQSVNNASNGYSSAIHGGTTDIMQVFGNVTANTQAPTLTTSSSVGVVFDGDITFDSLNYMTLPKGTTAQANRGRAILMGGIYPETTSMETYSLISSSNSVKFGSLGSSAIAWGGAMGNSTRSVTGGGNGQIDTIEYVELTTLGNAADFGNLTVGRRHAGPLSNSTRGIWGGGETAGGTTQTDTIDYVTIATTGNAADFGNLTDSRRGQATGASPTRGLFAAGDSPGAVNIIDYITIATTGNATDFGDTTATRTNSAGCSNTTRAVFGGGTVSPTYVNTLDYVTIATTGDATDFGDLFQAVYSIRGCSASHIRGNWNGGHSSAYINVIQSITFSTTGNAIDWGDMVNAKGGYNCTTSDCHGGLSE